MDNKILEVNNKVFDDNKQIFKDYLDKDFTGYCELLKNENYVNSITGLCFTKGQKITIEAEITDSYFSSMLSMAINGHSQFGNSSGLDIMGMKIETIHFRSAAVFNEQENAILQEAAKILKNKLNPNE